MAKPNLLNLKDRMEAELRRNSAFVEAAEFIGTIGSLEQAESEAKQRTAAAYEEMQKAERDLAAMRIGATGDIDAAKAEAKNIRESARKDAEAVKAEAEVHADQVRAKALVDGEKILTAARAGAASAGDRAQTANLAVENARTQLADLQRKVEEKAGELAAIEERIARAKESARQIIAG